MTVSHWATIMIGPDGDGQIVSFCTVHLFRFIGGDGGETEECTVHVLSRIAHTQIEIVEGKCGLAEFSQILLPGRVKTVFYEKLNSSSVQ
jgi:hypothetical protein